VKLPKAIGEDAWKIYFDDNEQVSMSRIAASAEKLFGQTFRTHFSEK
jgi:hypothetical protein